MQEKLRFLGLDVHAETIAVAIAEPDYNLIELMEIYAAQVRRKKSQTLFISIKI